MKQAQIGDRVRVLKSPSIANKAVARMIGREGVVVDLGAWGCAMIADPKDSKRPEGWLFSPDEFEILDPLLTAE